MTTPRGYDWRPIAYALMAQPGTTFRLPADAPALNPTYVRDGRYRAFEAPLAFEVRGKQKGQQSARYVGEVDLEALYALMHERGIALHADAAALLPRRCYVPQWHEHGAAYPGFTTLPLPTTTPAAPAPLILEEA